MKSATRTWWVRTCRGFSKRPVYFLFFCYVPQIYWWFFQNKDAFHCYFSTVFWLHYLSGLCLPYLFIYFFCWTFLLSIQMCLNIYVLCIHTCACFLPLTAAAALHALNTHVATLTDPSSGLIYAAVYIATPLHTKTQSNFLYEESELEFRKQAVFFQRFFREWSWGALCTAVAVFCLWKEALQRQWSQMHSRAARAQNRF